MEESAVIDAAVTELVKGSCYFTKRNDRTHNETTLLLKI
jgi:hypothetical protein